MLWRLRHILIIIFLFTKINAGSQLDSNPKHHIGFVYGKGSQDLMNVVYTYNITLFQLQYAYTFVNRPKFGLEVLVQPQYNIAKFRYVDQLPRISQGYEYGLNVGLSYKRYFFHNRFSCFASIGFGPHFVSAAPERQTPGFLFSDNVSIGMTARLDKHFYFELKPTFRHISNANIIKPNRGINNFIINAGIFYYIN